MLFRITICLLIFIILVSISLHINVQAQVEKEEEEKEKYYFLKDEYAEYYDKNYFRENALKINEINNKILENSQLLATQDIDRDKIIDPSQLLNSESKIAFVMPTFTMAAYDFSFYPFFRMHADIKHGDFVKSSLELLSVNVPTREESFNNHKSFGLHQLRAYTSSLLPNADLNYLTDEDVHNGLIFNQGNKNKENLYDILIMGHSEYVTQQEYSNFKKFVENGGVLVMLDANTFYAEVDYDTLNNKITFVKGHYWGFDGEKAWRDVKERWADETTEWAGSNFGCSSCEISFNNNPFSYSHYEENYLTNPNAKILIDYQAQSEYNYKIAAYELHYGLGKVVSLGIFGSNIVENNRFLQFYQDILMAIV
jgi:hypothetical protein